jgi:hypothetical protein
MINSRALRPFTIAIPQADVEDLQDRLASRSFPPNWKPDSYPPPLLAVPAAARALRGAPERSA